MSSRLAKTFAIQLVFLVVLFVSVHYVYGKYSEGKIQKALHIEAANEFSLFQASTDNILQQIKNMTVQFSLDPAINQLLKDPNNASKFNYTVVRNELKQIASSNDLIYSMYIHSRINDKVITTREGIYQRKDFYDRDLLGDFMVNGDNAPDYISRTLTLSSDEPVRLLTSSQKLPIFSNVALASLVVNIREDVLLQSLSRLDETHTGNIFIDHDKIVHWVRKDISAQEKQKLLGQLTNGVSTFKKIETEAEGLYAAVVVSPFSKWTYVKMIPEYRYRGLLHEEKKHSLQVMLGLFLIIYIVSVLLLRRMNAPWRDLLSRLSQTYKSPERPSFLRDEIKAVNHSIDQMLHENFQFQRTFEDQLQIVREKLLMDLLWSQIDDRELLAERMTYCKVDFPKSKYLVLVAAIDHLSSGGAHDYKNLLAAKIYAKHVVEHTFSQKVVIRGILLDENYLAFILNIDGESMQESLRKFLASACMEVNKTLKESDSGLVSFMFGPIVEDLFKLRISFISARRRADYRSFFPNNYVFHDDSQENSEFVYPMQLQKEIINGVKSGQTELISNAVDQLFDQVEGMGQYAYSDLQQALSLLLSGVVSELWIQGEDLRKLLSVSKIRKTLDSNNKERLKVQVFEHLVTVMNEVSSDQKTETSKKVAQVMEIMDQRFSEDFTIQELADEVMLTPAYMCRIFKEATGRTPLEYLTYKRIQFSFGLLRVKDLTIKEISERVGYREVRSYIRFFKRQEGITPGVYRDNLSNPQ